MTLELVIVDIDFWESPRLPIRKEKEILFVEGEKFFREESFEKRRKKILGNRVLTLEIDMVKGVAEFTQYWRA